MASQPHPVCARGALASVPTAASARQGPVRFGPIVARADRSRLNSDEFLAWKEWSRVLGDQVGSPPFDTPGFARKERICRVATPHNCMTCGGRCMESFRTPAGSDSTHLGDPHRSHERPLRVGCMAEKQNTVVLVHSLPTVPSKPRADAQRSFHGRQTNTVYPTQTVLKPP